MDKAQEVIGVQRQGVCEDRKGLGKMSKLFKLGRLTMFSTSSGAGRETERVHLGV